MCAIKEESKVANRAWIDHQACSLLQYIIVITGPRGLIGRTYHCLIMDGSWDGGVLHTIFGPL